MKEISVSANGQEKKPLTLQSLQKHITTIIFSAITGALLISVAFYFHTNYTLIEQGTELNLINKRIDAHDAKMEIEQVLEKLNLIEIQKLDKIIQLLEEMKKEKAK